MTVLTEAFHAGGFIVSEANNLLSRDVGTLSNAVEAIVDYAAGLVMAQDTVGAATAAAKTGGNTGNGTITLANPSRLVGCQVGVYTVRCISAATNGGVFRVTAPGGVLLGDVTITGGAGGTGAFANQVAFTLTDAGTDFIVGDGFDVTVAAGTGRWSPFLDTALQTRLGILFARTRVPAASGGNSGVAPATVVVRHAEINASELVYDASLTSGALTAARADAATLLAQAAVILR